MFKTCTKCGKTQSVENYLSIGINKRPCNHCDACRKAYREKYRASEKGRAKQEAFEHEMLLRWLAAKS